MKMVDSAKILRFLQKCKFDLAREVPGYVDAHIAKDGSAKLVLRVSAPLATPPVLSFEEETIPLEVVVDFPDAKPVDKAVVMAGPMSPTSVPPQPTGQVGTVALPEKVAIGPHEAGARDSAAFEAWKKRHSAVKIGG
jgi:hypothetical protein